MSLLTTSAAGIVMFAAQLLFVLYVLRMLAIRTAHTGFGAGLGALVF